MKAKEKKLIILALEELYNNMCNAGCNDLPESWSKVFTTGEWMAFNKEYHEYNGDPEEWERSVEEGYGDLPPMDLWLLDC